MKKVSDTNEECKSDYYSQCTTNLIESDSKKEDCYFMENVIEIERFSLLKKLFRVTCYVLRFKKNSLAKLRNEIEKFIKGVIFFDEMSEPKYLWLLSEQNKILKITKI